MVRSLENLPMRAVLRMAIFAQSFHSMPVVRLPNCIRPVAGNVHLPDAGGDIDRLHRDQLAIEQREGAQRDQVQIHPVKHVQHRLDLPDIVREHTGRDEVTDADLLEGRRALSG